MTVDPRPQKSPEVLSSAEGGDGEDFNDLLRGMLDLTSLEGNVTAVEFIERTIQEMEKMEIKPNDYRIGLILQHGIGTRERVMDRVTEMSTEEFERAYPGVVGELVKWYLDPLLSE